MPRRRLGESSTRVGKPRGSYNQDGIISTVLTLSQYAILKDPALTAVTSKTLSHCSPVGSSNFITFLLNVRVHLARTL